jgi:hypothetical protein
MIPKRVGDGCAGFCSLFSFTRCVGGAVIDREAQFVAKGSPVDRVRQTICRNKA